MCNTTFLSCYIDAAFILSVVIELETHLNVWYFMMKVAKSCTSESLPAVGNFMVQISNYDYEWDASHYDLHELKTNRCNGSLNCIGASFFSLLEAPLLHILCPTCIKKRISFMFF